MNSLWLFKRLDEIGSNPSQFANALGWQKSRVYELKSGKTKKIPNEYLSKAAQFLNIDMNTLVALNNGEEVKKIPPILQNTADVSLSKNEFKQFIYNVFCVFLDCKKECNISGTAEQIAEKMADVCYSAIKFNNIDNQQSIKSIIFAKFERKKAS